MYFCVLEGKGLGYGFLHRNFAAAQPSQCLGDPRYSAKDVRIVVHFRPLVRIFGLIRTFHRILGHFGTLFGIVGYFRKLVRIVGHFRTLLNRYRTWKPRRHHFWRLIRSS